MELRTSAIPTRPVTLTFLSTTDEHGHLLPQDGEAPNRRGKPTGGAAHLAGTVLSIRSANPNTILTSSGDFFQETPISELFDGRPMIEAMNQMGYDALELGNHDFDFGMAKLHSLLGQAAFPVLGANIAEAGKTEKTAPFVQPYVLKQVGGITVGIVGIDTPDVPELTRRKHVEHLAFLSPKETLQRLIPEMRRRGADVIVLLSHQGSEEDRKLAEEVQGIDLIWSGHSHEFLEKPIRVGSTLIAQAGCYLQALGRMDLEVDPSTRKIAGSRYQLIPIDPARSPSDPSMADLVEKYNAQTRAILSQLIGFSQVELSHSETGAKNLDHYVIDQFQRGSGADLALMNASAVRKSLPAGPITVGDLYQVFPFHTNLVVMDLTGSQIKSLLEHSADMDDDRSLYVSAGMRVTYDTRKPEGERLISATLNGEPIDDRKVYRVACDSFLAEGGLGYEAFTQGQRVEEGLSIKELLKIAIAKETPISPKDEARITDLAPPPHVKGSHFPLRSPMPDIPLHSWRATVFQPRPRAV